MKKQTEGQSGLLADSIQYYTTDLGIMAVAPEPNHPWALKNVCLYTYMYINAQYNDSVLETRKQE